MTDNTPSQDSALDALRACYASEDEARKAIAEGFSPRAAQPLADKPGVAEDKPVAYLHTMHMEGGQTYDRLTLFNGIDPDDARVTAFGIPGRDYSEEYSVSTTPLYARAQSEARQSPDGGREREALMKAIGWFEEYANNHTAKGTEDGRKKAVTNQLRAAELRAALTPPADDARPYQDRVNDWMLACFGSEIADDRLERGDRFIEEALELAQTVPGFTSARAHALVDYVFGRDVGERHQEVGGVMVTLAALCNTFEVNIPEAAECELARVWTKVDAIRAKQAAKPTGSALPVAYAPADDVARTNTDVLVEALRDPNAVHINMLRGGIAKPSLAQIIHIYGRDAVEEALSVYGEG